MYLLRGSVILLAIFFLIFTALSLVVACVSRLYGSRIPLLNSRSLYALRVAPFVGSWLMVVLFVTPSFITLEPRHADETVGLLSLALAIGGAAVIAYGLTNMARSWMVAREYVLNFAAQPGPAILIAGVYRPRLLISPAAHTLLQEGELRAALRHEHAHIQNCDNLKKLLLKLSPFPGLGPLERAWSHALELEADMAAATDQQAALDLASALLKMARHPAPTDFPAITTALVSANDSLLAHRVQELLSWRPRGQAPRPAFPALLIAIACGTSMLAAHSSPVLAYVHEFTENLIR